MRLFVMSNKHKNNPLYIKENNVYGYVYKITNNINGKIYVGATTHSIMQRWREHINTAYGNSKDNKSLFKKAIRKYGKENFTVEMIKRCYGKNELNNSEIEWIEKMNSFAFKDNSNGYNSTIGGMGIIGYSNNTPVCKIDIVKGKVIEIFNSIREAEVNIGVRICTIDKKNHTSGGYYYMYKKDVDKYSEEELITYVHSRFDYLLYQLDENGKIINIYKDVADLKKKTNVSNVGNIVSCCLGSRRLFHNYQWCYQKDLNDRINKKPRDIIKTSKKINQYSLSGKFIREWNSIIEASKVLKISSCHISQCCKKTRSLSGNYQWRYADECINELPPLTIKAKVQCIETGIIYDTCNDVYKKTGIAGQTVKKSCNGKEIHLDKNLHFRWYYDE